MQDGQKSGPDCSLHNTRIAVCDNRTDQINTCGQCGYAQRIGNQTSVYIFNSFGCILFHLSLFHSYTM